MVAKSFVRAPTALAIRMAEAAGITLAAIARTDGFGVLWSLIASLAPIGRHEDGRLFLRVPGTGAAKLAPAAGVMALLIVSIGSTAFDGAKEGALFNDLAIDLQDFFNGLGLSLSTSLQLGFVVGLAAAIAIVAIIWTLGMLGTGSLSNGRRFAHTLIPIASGYLVALVSIRFARYATSVYPATPMVAPNRVKLPILLEFRLAAFTPLAFQVCPAVMLSK